MNAVKFLNQFGIDLSSKEEVFKNAGISISDLTIEIQDFTNLKILLNFCEQIPDYRSNKGNFKHRLSIIVFMSIIAIICLCKNLREISSFIKVNYEKFIDLFYPLNEYPDRDDEKNNKYFNVPSYSTLERNLQDIESADLEKCLHCWEQAIGISKHNNLNQNHILGSDLNEDLIRSSISKKSKVIEMEVREDNYQLKQDKKDSKSDIQRTSSKTDDFNGNINAEQFSQEYSKVDIKKEFQQNAVLSLFNKYSINKDFAEELLFYLGVNSNNSEITSDGIIKVTNDSSTSDCTQITEINHIALDGKAIRGSGCIAQNQRPTIVVTAYNVENKKILASKKVEIKTNEISANKEIFDEINLEGSFVSFDALGTQKALISKLHGKGCFYTAQVKGNQEKLEMICTLRTALYTPYPFLTIIEKNRDRIETREFYLTNQVQGIENLGWEGIASIGKIVKTTTYPNANKKNVEEHFYIMNYFDKSMFVKITRGHWAIENSLHWVLDHLFDEDHSRGRKFNLPLNLNLMRKTGLSFLNFAKSLLQKPLRCIGEIGEIIRAKMHLINKICDGKKFDIFSEI